MFSVRLVASDTPAAAPSVKSNLPLANKSGVITLKSPSLLEMIDLTRTRSSSLPFTSGLLGNTFPSGGVGAII